MSKKQEEASEAQKDSALTGTALKSLPKGVVLGPDGKPCRSCTSFSSWAQLTKSQTKSPAASASTSSASSSNSTSQTPRPTAPPADCPPDVEALGRSTWTFLHTLTANYPQAPTATQQQAARTFVASFAQLYPCWSCAEDFRRWLAQDGNAPRVSSRSDFGRWMCEAHNAVNGKLGKELMDCGRWEERWRTGWLDGRCD